jgi:23S rRNA pseudouridine1911/1915/1917 synthase
VHFASIGYPICGDTLYGGDDNSNMARQALHADKLAFRHPVTDAEIELTAEMPCDIANLSLNIFSRV